MNMFLNSSIPYERYKEITESRFFVDKTALIGELLTAITLDRQRCFCITRPRRFGKSVMANMVGAFFGKAINAGDLFGKLQIANDKNFELYQGKYQLIYIDFSRVPDSCDSYTQYMMRIQKGLRQDLKEAYSDIGLDEDISLWDLMMLIFEATGDRFVFVMDEWDAVFHMPFISDVERKDYLLFLKNLLKDQPYIELAYMTGVLPIAKYSSGSELNMFLEYDMATKRRFSSYFGFLDEEVDRLYHTYQMTTDDPVISRDELRLWYDGYYTAKGKRLYNPRSIVCALSDNQLANYWTSSGPYDEIFYYIRNNIEEVREDLVLLVAGEGIRSEVRSYAAASMQITTRSEIYSAMVVYGLLTYDDETGKVFIPNRELMEKFKELLLEKKSLGYVYRLANESEKMLTATLAGDTKTMISILQFAHNTESPIFSYNHEIELAAVVNLVYLSARDLYRVEREDKAGKGYVDFIFYPERRSADAIILELKVDDTPEAAVSQIKDKQYALRFKGKLGEKKKYFGRILAVGISYDKTTKEHDCRIEAL